MGLFRPCRGGVREKAFHGLRFVRGDAGCAAPVATFLRPVGAKRGSVLRLNVQAVMPLAATMMIDSWMIEPHENTIAGQWIVSAGSVAGDDACERISVLIRQHLIRICADASGWDSLYLDPSDKRLWELIYPQSAMHGGGPPQLNCVSPEYAAEKYGTVFTDMIEGIRDRYS